MNLTCNQTHYWYYFNHTLGEYNIVSPGRHLTFNATTEDSGKYICSPEPSETLSSQVINLIVVERLSQLRLVATPSQPVVMEGQRVVLHCQASTYPPAANWSWYHMSVLNVQMNMSPGRDLVISRPEESGLYNCRAHSLVLGISQTQSSPYHLIYVVPMTGPAVVDDLGVAGFGLSLLVCLILLAALLWFAWGRCGARCLALQQVTSSSAKAKGLTASKMAPSDGLPHAESQGDYMNFTTTNLAYAELEPNSRTRNDVYSSLS